MPSPVDPINSSHSHFDHVEAPRKHGLDGLPQPETEPTMAERERVQHFRQRWAQEHHGTSLEDTSSGPNVSPPSQRRNQLSEVAAPALPRRSDRADLTAKRIPSWKGIRSWRSSRLFRNSTSPTNVTEKDEDLNEVLAPPPLRPRRPSVSRLDEETALPPRQSSSVAPTKAAQTTGQVPPWLTEVYTVSYLIFFAIMGVLARLGVEVITQYPNAPVTSRVLWANVGGSFVMGFLSEDRRIFKEPTRSDVASTDRTTKEHQHHPIHDREHHPAGADTVAAYAKFKKTIPLYIGLTTGFCGSFTSFSSYVRDAFLALTNGLQPPSSRTPYRPQTALFSRNGGFSAEAVIAILIVHPAVSLASLQAGAALALWLGPILRPLPAGLLTRFVNPVMVVLALGSWLGASLVLTVIPPSSEVINWRTRALLPMLLAPPGCLARYYLSKYLNTVKRSFPLGTFVSNIFATFVLGMAFDLQHTSWASPNSCAVLYGVQEGFCGCLSTVSTWVLELETLSRRHAWTYGLVSVGVGLAGLVAIMGSVAWTIGFAEPKCG